MTVDTPSDKNPSSRSVPQKDRDAAAAKKQWQEQETFLEEALEESFPASDPIATGHVPPVPSKPKS
jgi:hypothetical protein